MGPPKHSAQSTSTAAAQSERVFLDQSSALEIARNLCSADQRALDAVREAQQSIADVIEATTERMRSGGRLFYLGAGTSGRLAALDAAECPPTFGTSPDRVQAILAGGTAAMSQAAEGAEDQLQAASLALQAQAARAGDVVLGIAASGRTPFVMGGLQWAKEQGIWTVALVCCLDSPLAKLADQAIELNTGPEVLAGSTRLKAGTATKLALNTLSTGVMAHLGHVFENRMVRLAATNNKLRERALTMLRDWLELDDEQASHLLQESELRVDLAIVRWRLQCDLKSAHDWLKQPENDLRKIVRP